jgi:hydroxymethylpyrimidine pyrophosphatase-like HAD family hydrolase
MINNWVFVDVDGTLGKPVIEWIEKHSDDCRFVLWSARGEEYARNVADSLGISGLFEYVISKPGHIIDDKGWGWIRHTRVIKRL